MAISLRAAGTATSATAATTAVSPAVPAGATTGDLSVLTVWMKPYTTTITTPSGWLKISEATNGTVAGGTDTGSTKIAVFVRASASVGAIGNLTFGGSPNSCGAVINTYQNATGGWDFTAFTTGGDTTNGANYSATGAAGIDVASGDWVCQSTAVNGDVGTLSAFAIAGMSGATLGTYVNRQSAAVTTGNDTRGVVGDIPISSGSSSSAPTFTYTNASSGSGTTLWLRLREIAVIGKTTELDYKTRTVISDTATLRHNTVSNITGRVPPTLVSTTLVPSTSWGASNAGATSASIAVQTGDRILVVGGGENDAVWIANITDSAGNSYDFTEANHVTNACYVFIGTATAATSTNITVTLSSTMSPNWTGWAVYVFRNSDGFGSTPAYVDNNGATPSLAVTTTTDHSTVVTIMADWSAASSTPVYRTGFGTATEDAVHQGEAVHWGTRLVRHADAGTAAASAVGISSGAAGTNWSIMAVEVKGSSSGSLTAVQDSVQIIHNTEAIASDISQIIHKTRALTGDTSQIIHKTRTFSGDTSQIVYDTHAIAGDSCQIVYNVLATAALTAIGDTIELDYRTRSLCTDSAVLIHNTRYALFDTTQLIHDVLTIVSGGSATSWANASVAPNTSGTATTVTYNFTPASVGSLLVAICAGPVTWSTPTGWSLLLTEVDFDGLYVFTKTASASESSFQSTHNGTGGAVYPNWAVVYEFPAGSSINASIGTTTANNGSSWSDLPTLTGLTGINTILSAVVMSDNSSTDATATWSSLTPQQDLFFDGSNANPDFYIGYADGVTSSTFTQQYTKTNSAGSNAHVSAVQIAINVAGGGPSTGHTGVQIIHNTEAIAGDTSQLIHNTRAIAGDTSQLIYKVLFGLALTQLNKDSVLRYNTRASTYDSSQIVYNVRAAAYDSSQLVHKTRTIAGDISQIVHNTRAVAFDSSQLVYRVAYILGDSSQLIYKTRAIAFDSSQLIYSTRTVQTGTSQRQLIYKTRAIAGDSSQVVYNSRALAYDTSQIVYNTRSLASDSLVLRYNTSTFVYDTAQLVYKVLYGITLFQVGQNSTIRYNSRSIVYDLSIIQYNSRATSYDSVQLIYDAHTFVSDSSILRHNTRYSVYDSVSMLHNTRTVTFDSSQIIYKTWVLAYDSAQIIHKTRAVAGDTSQLIYKTRAIAGDSSQLIHMTRALLYDLAQLIYNVRVVQTGTSQRQFIYRTRALAGDNSQLVYKTRAVAGDNSTIVYHVLNLNLSVLGKNSQIIYKTRAIAFDSSQLIYRVAYILSDSSQLVYKTRALASDSEQIRHNTRASLYDSVQFIYKTRVVQSGVSQRQILHKTRALISDSSQLSHKTRAVSSDSLTMIYRTRVNVGSDSEIIYNVAVNISASEQIVHNTLIYSGLSIVLLYKVLSLSINVGYPVKIQQNGVFLEARLWVKVNGVWKTPLIHVL